MVGYAVGAGAEYALGYGWSIKSEYIYINFKSKDFFGQGTSAISCCAIPTFVSPTKVSLYDHTFKWGLNYKFDLALWDIGDIGAVRLPSRSTNKRSATTASATQEPRGARLEAFSRVPRFMPLAEAFHAYPSI